MKNIAIKISYKGTGYAGWQIQKNGPSVQEELEHAIKALTGETVKVTGSGRTDAGVHAAGQVANFLTNSNIPPDKFALALNGRLPEDIRTLSSVQVRPDFNARYDAVSKTYLYIIENKPIKTPFLRDLTMQVKEELDFGILKTQLNAIVGTHDFTSLYKVQEVRKNPVRTVNFVKAKNPFEHIYTIEVNANGFLYNMMRIIAGSLIKMAAGKSDYDMKTVLEQRDRRFAPYTAQPSGLYLKEVIYDTDIFK